MVTIITRKQLFDRVWRQPIIHIAKEFGISDVGLRKACKRHRIPTPPAGYWAKLAHGKAVTAAKLPDPDDDHPIRIWRGGGNEPDEIARARAEALAAVPQVPAAAADHPAVERTMAKLSSAKPGRNGLIGTSGAKLVTVSVRPGSAERVGQLLRDLVAAGEGAGMTLKPGPDGMAWHVGGETVAFQIVEAADRVEHVATDKELAAHAKWQREREERHKRYGYWSSYGEPKIPKWEERYNGRLAVRLEQVRIKNERDPWGKAIRGTFADSRTRDVSRAIPSIVATIAAMAAAKRGNAAYEERRRVAEEEARERWHEEERRRYQWERAGKLVEELMELGRKAAGLQQWLAGVRANGALQPRSRQLVELVERQLADLQDRLGNAALERRLEAARLFQEAD